MVSELFKVIKIAPPVVKKSPLNGNLNSSSSSINTPEYSVQTVAMYNKNIKLSIWDTSNIPGETRETCINIYLQDAHAIWLLCDLSSSPQKMREDLANNYELISHYLENGSTTVLLVGTKIETLPTVQQRKNAEKHLRELFIEFHCDGYLLTSANDQLTKVTAELCLIKKIPSSSESIDIDTESAQQSSYFKKYQTKILWAAIGASAAAYAALIFSTAFMLTLGLMGAGLATAIKFKKPLLVAARMLLELGKDLLSAKTRAAQAHAEEMTHRAAADQSYLAINMSLPRLSFSNQRRDEKYNVDKEWGIELREIPREAPMSNSVAIVNSLEEEEKTQSSSVVFK
jgi:GTPase SAR1 family protein